jgi:hypothetical protein
VVDSLAIRVSAGFFLGSLWITSVSLSVGGCFVLLCFYLSVFFFFSFFLEGFGLVPPHVFFPLFLIKFEIGGIGWEFIGVPT